MMYSYAAGHQRRQAFMFKGSPHQDPINFQTKTRDPSGSCKIVGVGSSRKREYESSGEYE